MFPPHGEEEPVEVVQASGWNLSRKSDPGHTERDYISAGLGIPCCPLRGVGGSGLGEVSLGLLTCCPLSPDLHKWQKTEEQMKRQLT